MTLVQTLLTTQLIVDSFGNIPSGHWGSYAETISPAGFTDGGFEGNYATWGGAINNSAINSFNNAPYAGYTTNWGGLQENTMLNLFINAPYAGYTTNFGGRNIDTTPDFTVVDYNSVIDIPKDQFVYYKLKGFNTVTQAYETWIEKEDITSRPELFDPGRHPPTYERGVNLISPSGAVPAGSGLNGNALVNITIVARWIQ